MAGTFTLREKESTRAILEEIRSGVNNLQQQRELEELASRTADTKKGTWLSQAWVLLKKVDPDVIRKWIELFRVLAGGG